jgi:hypothetical protein
MDKAQPMTYREIREYLKVNDWGFPRDDGGYVIELPGLPSVIARWVTHEVLPEIRRTGGYKVPDHMDQVPSSWPPKGRYAPDPVAM